MDGVETMDCTRCADLIDELVDGALDAATAAAVERHATGCAACARQLTDTRALVAAAAALGRAVPAAQPAASTWDAIAARTVARRSPARRAPWLAYAMAAAVLAGLGGIVALRLVATPPAADADAALVPRTFGSATLAVANPSMERRAHLVSDVTGDGRHLSPAALATVERNLKVIHAALGEIEAAVQADPNDPNLRRLLTEIHQQESALIARMQQISIEPNRRTDI